MRELKRSIAKGNMERAGHHQLTKGGIFCNYWRDYLPGSDKNWRKKSAKRSAIVRFLRFCGVKTNRRNANKQANKTRQAQRRAS